MPIFSNGKCALKFVIFAGLLIGVISVIAVLFFATLGFYPSLAVIVLAAITLRYVVDQFGDFWLCEDKHNMTSSEIVAFGNRDIKF